MSTEDLILLNMLAANSYKLRSSAVT